ncbi:serine/threonine protein kinase [Microbacterium sp. CJ88]|uniref:serine/threonine protein kinase n=1 Tax=Microbacterium sp. CJ88 TaxID=3445672 RepID=UPI003F657E15
MTEGLVAGRFRIRGLLGSGGTASVFDAEDTVDGRPVALKLLHPHLAGERSVWDAFFEEVHAAQSIAHPGLAEVYDAGVEDVDPPIVWISMEPVRGVSLAEHVRASGPLAVAAAVALTSAVLDALAAAHAGGVVHRDVTPANVMLDPDLLASSVDAPFDPEAFGCSIRLLDFGLADIPGRSTVGADALLSTAATAPAGVVASVPYASPEQLSAAAVREASDLYQVGATLHFALTGRPPFLGDTAAVVRAHLSAPPPVPSASRKGLPRGIDRVVTTAMLKRPEDRYADAAAMRAALVDAALPLRAPAADQAVAGLSGVAAEATRVTRVYRTTVGADAPTPDVPFARPPAESGGSGGGWQAWAIGAVVVAVIATVVGVSAMAANTTSAPEASASASISVSPAPTATPPAPTETTAPSAQVPEVTGMTVVEARAALERVGLLLGEVTKENSPSVGDTVLGTSPVAGQWALLGRTVAVRAASGDNAVPPVVGLSAAEAAAILTAAGFPSHITEVMDGTPGFVATSSPAPGVVSRVGSTVILSVPRTPTHPPMQPTATPTGGPTPLPTGSSTPVP